MRTLPAPADPLVQELVGVVVIRSDYKGPIISEPLK